MDTGDDVLIPLDNEEYESLLMDIGAHGVRCAVIYAADGETVIDGRNRIRAAQTLGRDWPREILPISDPNEILAATMFYNRPRIVNVKKRNAIIIGLDADGKTQVEIARLTGLARSSVQAILRKQDAGASILAEQQSSRQVHPSAQRQRVRKMDTQGRMQPAQRVTKVEQARRFGMMLQLAKKGHSGPEIARALDVSRSQVTNEMRNAGFPLPRMQTSSKGEVKGVWRWRDVDQPKPPTDTQRWRRSRVMFATQAWRDEYTEQSFANIFANHVREAMAANDDAWVKEAHALVNDAFDKVQRLSRILADDEYRNLCWQTPEGDEIGRKPSLRLVGNDALR